MRLLLHQLRHSDNLCIRPGSGQLLDHGVGCGAGFFASGFEAVPEFRVDVDFHG